MRRGVAGFVAVLSSPWSEGETAIGTRWRGDVEGVSQIPIQSDKTQDE